jgi:hypothetical protein
LGQFVFLVDAVIIQNSVDLAHLETANFEVDLRLKFQDFGELEGERFAVPCEVKSRESAQPFPPRRISRSMPISPTSRRSTARRHGARQCQRNAMNRAGQAIVRAANAAMRFLRYLRRPAALKIVSSET